MRLSVGSAWGPGRGSGAWWVPLFCPFGLSNMSHAAAAGPAYTTSVFCKVCIFFVFRCFPWRESSLHPFHCSSIRGSQNKSSAPVADISELINHPVVHRLIPQTNVICLYFLFIYYVCLMENRGEIVMFSVGNEVLLSFRDDLKLFNQPRRLPSQQGATNPGMLHSSLFKNPPQCFLSEMLWGCSQQERGGARSRRDLCRVCRILLRWCQISASRW